MFLIEFKWPIVLVSVMELPDCLWVLAVSFSACEDFFNYNSWEKLLIARRNIELKSCITEFWSSDKWRNEGNKCSDVMSERYFVLCLSLSLRFTGKPLTAQTTPAARRHTHYTVLKLFDAFLYDARRGFQWFQSWKINRPWWLFIN